MTQLAHPVQQPRPAAAPAPIAADAVLGGLAAAGVRTVVGFPGETSLPLYLAAQRQDAIRHVMARCPRCAGYMAEAYARISGEVGVCDAPGGIGSPFTVPALLEAYNSSTPLVFVASGVSRTNAGRWTTGECAQQELFGAVTKDSVRVELPEDVAGHLVSAVHTAAAPRGGPVFVEIPSDVLAAPVADARPASAVQEPLRAAPTAAAVALIADHVRTARSVVIVAGGGVHQGDAAAELRDLVAATGLPVATTLNGKGAVDERLPFAAGVTGAKGSFAANDFVRCADVVLAIGTKLGDKSTDKYRWPREGQVVVHVDSSPAELARRGHPSVPVLADAGEFCRALTGELAGYRYPGPLPVASPVFWDRGLTDHLCNRLSGELGEEDIVVADASVSSGWAGAAIRFSGGRQRLLTPRGSGSISYALPAALGAKLARPDARVFGIGGDGGLSIAMHEFETAVRNDLPITYFLLNNERLGLIDRHAVDLLGGGPVSAGFGSLDWQAIAAAFGWRGLRVGSGAELDAVWDEAVAGTGPTLVECVVPADEGAPDFIVTKQGERKA
ncbi:thiamine pyrophosphate-binding protein [Amycolatopsis sp. NPDC059657]|uniref:thiamine pyrophosphate-binding protein n=1 Tax=Amycolatopsis sp. NPDC059657 TaxID=3346899 RepID=UPI00366E65E6